MEKSKMTNGRIECCSLLSAKLLLLGMLLALGCSQNAKKPQSSTASLADAESAFRVGDLDRTEKILQQVLLENPSQLDAELLMSQVLVAKGELLLAAEFLIESSGPHTELRPRLLAQASDLFFQCGRYDQGIKLLGQVVDEYPKQYEIRRRLADALNEKGRRFDANEHLRFLAGRTRLSIRELTTLINPLLTWRSFSQKPDLQDGEFVQAAGMLNVVAALRANGEVREALSVLESSPQLDDNEPSTVAMKGWLLALNQRYEELEQWISSIDSSCKRFPAYWLAQGELMLHRSDDLAVACFAEALRREPGSVDAVQGLVQSASLFRSKEVPSAAWEDSFSAQALDERLLLIRESAELARAINASPQRALQLSGEMGRVMNAMGRYSESLAWQEAVLDRVAPDSANVTAIRKHKIATLAKYPSGMNVNEVLCGLTVDEFNDLKSRLNSVTQRKRKSSAESTLLDAKPRFAKASIAKFVNVAHEVAVQHRHVNSSPPVQKEFRLYEALGSGVACLDFDQDGLVDLYLGQAGCVPTKQHSSKTNHLYRNNGQRFSRRTAASGTSDFQYTHGVTAGDWNQDGFPDLLIANIGVNRLLLNQGDGTFQVVAGDGAGLGDSSWRKGMTTMSMAIADMTGDAIPDIFEVNYVDDARVFDPIERKPSGEPIVLPGPKHFRAAGDRVFVTSPDGTLSAESLGDLTDVASTGMGLLVTDLDGDQANDVFVANDQNANQLWRRAADGSWADVAVLQGCAYGAGGRPMACMGIATADFNDDGRLDLHITNFSKEPSNLYLQNEHSVFQDASISRGLDQMTLPMVGFGTQVLDFDNNSTVDIVIGNGHIEDFRAKGDRFQMPTQLVTPSQEGYQLVDVVGDDYWQKEHLARAVAKLDWNRDGLVDIAVTDLIDDFVLLENRSPETGNYLQIRLVGTASERDAIGASVTVETKNASYLQAVQTGDGYLCKNEACLFFGLGKQESVDRVEIKWPSGACETIAGLKANRRHIVVEGLTAGQREK